MKNKIKNSLLLFSIFILVTSCTIQKERKSTISVDMSREHDLGYFKPEKGDKIGIAGQLPFGAGLHNTGVTDSLFLTDEDGDWIYTLSIRYKKNYIDSLEFKFFKTTQYKSPDIKIDWEKIPARKIALNDLINDQPVFVFNKRYIKGKIIEVTFTVGMNNQKVLGFFKPQEGDKIVVSGSFCDWREEGILMKDNNNDGIYTVTTPVNLLPNIPVEYKFRILTSRNVILIKKGWETTSKRKFYPTKENAKASYAEFSGLRRCARFILNTKEWEKDGKFKPLKGDFLQIKLILDGREILTDELPQINTSNYEIAVQIPITTKNIQWQIVKNINYIMTIATKIKVDSKGKLIKYNSKI